MKEFITGLILYVCVVVLLSYLNWLLYGHSFWLSSLILTALFVFAGLINHLRERRYDNRERQRCSKPQHILPSTSKSA
ncbi:hypothetical protein ACFL6I_19235 [candidate division KSB1 bacterium]